jgi:hypothetical protein
VPPDFACCRSPGFIAIIAAKASPSAEDGKSRNHEIRPQEKFPWEKDRRKTTKRAKNAAFWFPRKSVGTTISGVE